LIGMTRCARFGDVITLWNTNEPRLCVHPLFHIIRGCVAAMAPGAGNSLLSMDVVLEHSGRIILEQFVTHQTLIGTLNEPRDEDNTGKNEQ
jgi:hypothetical protein